MSMKVGDSALKVGDHLNHEVISLDGLLELARKTLVEFVEQKRGDLKATFLTYAQHSAGGDSGSDGSSMPLAKLSFDEFAAMVEAIDATRFSKANTNTEGNSEQKAGCTPPVRSRHELVEMYATATGQHHDADELEDEDGTRAGKDCDSQLNASSPDNCLLNAAIY